MKVALLGHRGMIGRHYLQLAHRHPWFSITPVHSVEEARRYPLIFTALPPNVAQELEPQLNGCRVISSSAAHREVAPVIIPEVNPEQLPRGDAWIVTKPNCTVHTFVLPLSPLHRAYEITALQITSMQALSGGGKRALNDPELKARVAIHIEGEEEKCCKEPLKIWGLNHLPIAAQCNRVPTTHGHVVSISVSFKKKPTCQEIVEKWESFSPLTLPSSPRPLICYRKESLEPVRGMEVQCARLQKGVHFDFNFIAAAHNVIRGGAGAGLLIAEYLYKENRFA